VAPPAKAEPAAADLQALWLQYLLLQQYLPLLSLLTRCKRQIMPLQ
jgi:hypothetical protein